MYGVICVGLHRNVRITGEALVADCGLFCQAACLTWTTVADYGLTPTKTNLSYSFISYGMTIIQSRDDLN